MSHAFTTSGRWTLLCFVGIGAGFAAPDGAVLGLDEAVQRALAHNKQIQVVRFSPEIARARLLAAKGVFDPTVTLGRDYASEETPLAPASPGSSQLTKRDNYQVSLNGLTPWGLGYQVGTVWSAERTRGLAHEYTAYSGVTLTQPLLRGAGLDSQLYEVRLLKADARISEWEFRQIVIDTVTRVIVAYAELQFAHEYLRVAQRSRDLAANLLKENEVRVQAGGMSNNQLVQARARAAARGETVILADRALRDADLHLRHLLGEDLSELPPLLRIQDRLESPAIDAATDLKTAWELRPDFQQARWLLRKRDIDLAYTRNWLMPRLDAVGSYGFNGADATASGSRRVADDRDFHTYSAGLVLSVPLTLARERGRLRAAKLEHAQAEAALDRLKQDIALNISLAAGRVDSVRQRIAATRAAYDLAHEALDDEVKKLRAGASTTFVVLSLQESLSSVELSMHRAIAEQRIAVALYDRETGGTLTRNRLSLPH